LIWGNLAQVTVDPFSSFFTMRSRLRWLHMTFAF
jgi:hypothetical protein